MSQDSQTLNNRIRAEEAQSLAKYYRDEALTAATTATGVAAKVENVASLKTFSFVSGQTPANNFPIQLLGYYEAGDGGGGDFYVDTNDTTTAEDGGLVYVTNSGLRIKRRNTKKVNIKAFGAKGDGVTDDTQAFVSAADAMPEGSVLTLTNDEYVSDNFQVSKSISIKGNKGVFKRGAGVSDGQALIRVLDGLSDVHISNLGIEMRHSEDAVNSYDGIICAGDLYNSSFTNLTINDVRSGIYFANGDIQDNIKIKNNRISAIPVPTGSTRDTSIHGNYGVIFGYKTKNCKIKYNTFTGFNIQCYVVGLGVADTVKNVRITESKNILIKDNVFIDSSDTAVYFYGKDITVKNNKLYNCGKDGIKFKSGFAGDATQDQVEVSHTCNITGNIIKGVGRIISSGGFAILTEGEDVTITDNHIYLFNNIERGWAATRCYGFAIKYAAVITGNRIHGDEGGDVRVINPVGFADGVQDINPNEYVKNVTFTGNYCRNLGMILPFKVRNWNITGNTFDRCTINVTNTGMGAAYPAGHNISHNNIYFDSDDRVVTFKYVSRIAFNGNTFNGRCDFTGLFLDTATIPNSWGNVDNVIEYDDYSTSPGAVRRFRPHGSVQHALLDTTTDKMGTVYPGEVFYPRFSTSTFEKFICLIEGTIGSLNANDITGTISASSNELTITAGMDFIHEGYFIVISGAGTTGTDLTCQVQSLNRSANTVVISLNAETAVTDAEITYKAPTFTKVNEGFKT